MEQADEVCTHTTNTPSFPSVFFTNSKFIYAPVFESDKKKHVKLLLLMALPAA